MQWSFILGSRRLLGFCLLYFFGSFLCKFWETEWATALRKGVSLSSLGLSRKGPSTGFIIWSNQVLWSSPLASRAVFVLPTCRLDICHLHTNPVEERVTVATCSTHPHNDPGYLVIFLAEKYLVASLSTRSLLYIHIYIYIGYIYSSVNS